MKQTDNNAPLKIKSLFDAPIVRCVVEDKVSGEIMYDGDEPVEANAMYNNMLKKGYLPKYTKTITRLVSERDKERLSGKKNNDELFITLIPRLPKRIQNIYYKILAQQKPTAASFELARKFHPDYFNQNL